MNGQLAPLLLAVRKQCIEVRGAQLQQSKTRERTQLESSISPARAALSATRSHCVLPADSEEEPLPLGHSKFSFPSAASGTHSSGCVQTGIRSTRWLQTLGRSLSFFFFWVCVICVCMCLHALMYVPQWAFGQPRVLVLTFYLLWDSFILFYLVMCVLGTWTQVLNLHASILPTELTPKMPFNVSYKDPSH